MTRAPTGAGRWWSRLFGAVWTSRSPLSSASAVRARHEAELMAIDGVVSVGVGRGVDGREVIIVGLADAFRAASSPVPSTINGVHVEVRVVGQPRA